MTILGWTLIRVSEWRDMAMALGRLQAECFRLAIERDRLAARIKAIRADERKRKAKALNPRRPPETP